MGDKICTSCGIEKDEIEFWFCSKKFRSGIKFYRRNQCKQCEARVAWRGKRAKSSELKLVESKTKVEHNRGYKQRNREFIKGVKSRTLCKDCGKQYPHYVMDFDHLHDKVDGVAQLAQKTVSLETLRAEIEKCDIVCANCHRERTWRRSHGQEIGPTALVG